MAIVSAGLNVKGFADIAIAILGDRRSETWYGICGEGVFRVQRCSGTCQGDLFGLGVWEQAHDGIRRAPAESLAVAPLLSVMTR